MRKLTVAHESWPIAGTFTISRGSKTVADVIVVTVEEGGFVGRGEGVPYPRYNETIAEAIAALETARTAVEAGVDRASVPRLVPPHAARNALDCALWDLEAKRSGTPVWQMAELPTPHTIVTAFTLSLGTVESMAEAAMAANDRPLLKIKLGQTGDQERLRVIRKAAPNCRLIVDANEGWGPEILASMLAVCAEVGVELVEQPLPAGHDEALRNLPRDTIICADESAHDSASLAGLIGKYDAVNIKLDKTGGLTEALAMARSAERLGLKIMAGCMVGTSLAMAPAMLLSSFAQVIDLDGPLLLAKDRNPGIAFDGSLMTPAPALLWG